MGNGNTWGSRVQGYVVQWVSATWAMGAHGAVGYRGMGNRGIWGNRVLGYGYRAHGQWVQGVWATWAIGYKRYRVQGYGHMGNRVQGYGVQDMGHMGNGVQGYGSY